MILALGTVAVHVAGVEEAVEFYTKKLGLAKKTDVTLGPELRWVTVGPKGQDLPEIFLKNPRDWYDKETAKKFTDIMGWVPTMVFRTDDCKKDYKLFKSRGVKFTQPPKKEPYGIEAVFVDPWDNPYSLLQPQ
jgi:predicted enzyme related to lactoylglutathione lyase